MSSDRPTLPDRIEGPQFSAAASVYVTARRFRNVLEVVVDSVLWAGALVLAICLRFASLTHGWHVADLLAIIVAAIAAQLLFGIASGLYRTRWRIGSFEQMLALTKTVAATTLVITVAAIVRPNHIVPVSVTIGGGAIAMVATTGLRSLWRVLSEHRLQRPDTVERAIIFGAGEGGIQIISSLLSDVTAPFVPVALLDDDPAKRNFQVRRLKVSGTRADLAATAAQHGADTLIIAIPSADSQLIRELSDLAAAASLTVKVLPRVSVILSGPLDASDIRPIDETDLLGRHVIDTEMASIAGYLTGKRVLVTGAGGSIGSELCRQIALFGPDRLVMLDRDESGLHSTQLSIEGRALLDVRTLVVCDIRDKPALDAVFAEHRPEVVFHAAALKHLPLLEMWPAEALKTNVYGTRNVLEAAAQVNVGRFVNISTDKAANPTSVLGATKRLAERLTARAGHEANGVYLSVRFGNVLGSRGSVLTAFRSQISAGGPVTVTHPEVTRFFMTVEEAVQLVVQAGAIGNTGEVLVLDMGQPVRIDEVAQRLVEEAGGGIEIVYTGLRPGEKLHEELFGDGEDDHRPVHQLISHVSVPPLGVEAIHHLGHAGAERLHAALLRACELSSDEGARPRQTLFTER